MITYCAKLTDIGSINERKIGRHTLEKNPFFVFTRMN